MAEHDKQQADSDLKKGAVEKAPDGGNAPPRDEQGRPKEAIAVTQDVTHANRKDIKKAEDTLGADENGTPG